MAAYSHVRPEGIGKQETHDKSLEGLTILTALLISNGGNGERKSAQGEVDPTLEGHSPWRSPQYSGWQAEALLLASHYF